MLRFEQEHAYSVRLVIDTGEELVEVTREEGMAIDEENEAVDRSSADD